MKGATQCAKRLKQLMRKLKVSGAKVPRSPHEDVLDQMILGIFSRDVPETRAVTAMGRLRNNVVDYNELRVVSAIEMAEIVGGLPGARIKCEDLSRALNRIFAKEHCVSLDGLASMSKKDMLAYLDDLDGLEAYTRARMRLFGLGKHAVPLDAAMWAYARKMEIVDTACELDEAQAFLERQVSEKDAQAFFAVVRKKAWTEMGAAVRKGAVEEICSIPPDRTTRNMLQMVAGGMTDTTVGTRPDAAPPAETPDKGAPASSAPAKASADKRSSAAGKRRPKRRAKTVARKKRAAPKPASARKAPTKRTRTARSTQR